MNDEREPRDLPNVHADDTVTITDWIAEDEDADVCRAWIGAPIRVMFVEAGTPFVVVKNLMSADAPCIPLDLRRVKLRRVSEGYVKALTPPQAVGPSITELMVAVERLRLAILVAAKTEGDDD